MANFTCALFLILSVVDYVAKFPFSTKEHLFLELTVGLFFFSWLHAVMPFWMALTSKEYKSLMQQNLGDGKSFTTKIILVFFGFFTLSFLFFYFGTSEQVTYFKLAFVFWGYWHFLVQTQAIYYTSLNPEHTKGVRRNDLVVLKYLVLLLFFSNCARLFDLRSGDLYQAPIEFIKYALYAMSAAAFMLLLYRSYKIKTNNKEQFIILPRFFLWIASLFSPMATYGLAAVHGSEYFDIMKKVSNRSTKTKAAWNLLFLLIASSLVLIFFDGVYATRVFEAYRLEGSIVASFVLAVGFSHYLFEGWMYRMKKPETREIVERLLGNEFKFKKSV